MKKLSRILHGIIAGASMVSSHVSQLVYQPIFETFAAGAISKRLNALCHGRWKRSELPRETFTPSRRSLPVD